ncbi:MAG: DEAD/DEAH box helicase [Clostridia bacterium]|nr:DEAD/DEAH box helicase [Clostridia bacterium]
MKYSESNINPNILMGVSEMGFTDMTPIQEQAIPLLLQGKDIIGQAQTGTGKTAAFGIPMIEQINPKQKNIQGLVLCPTRELAIQATEEIKKMSKYVPGVNAVAIYGGQDIERQFRKLKGPVSIVIGTPGRIMDHMRRGTLNFKKLKMLVLDEADEMLNMGFREDIETICREMPKKRQTALFSATMPREIMEITEEFQKDAELVRVKAQELTMPLIKQTFYVVKGRQKDTSLCRLLDYMSPKRALIFCNTKRKVDELTLVLKAKGYSAEALHGDLSQHQRDRVMNLFRNGNLELLLATDVAARGIDVDDVDMVFNYDMPQDMEYYVHRIGRTGRAGRKGRAVSIITNRERYKIESLRDYCNAEIKEKEMPSAGSALTVKAYKNVSEAMNYCREKDLMPYMKIVYKKCVEEEMDPLEVAAAFLRVSLGEIDAQAAEELQSSKQKKAAKKAAKAESPEKNGRGGRFGKKEKAGREGRFAKKDKAGKKEKALKKEKGNKNGKRAKSADKNRRHDSGRGRARKR